METARKQRRGFLVFGAAPGGQVVAYKKQESTSRGNNMRGLTERIAEKAEQALTDDAFERDAGMCQRFVRQVVQDVAGRRFDHFWGSTAENTARRFAKTGFVVPNGGYGQPGDLLYWRGTKNQTAGHVGIRIKGDRIAHNSVTDKHDTASGYKGRRDIKGLRMPDMVIRLR